MQRFGLLVGELLFVADLRQLGRGGRQLIADGRQLIFDDLALLPRLRQQGFEFLIVVVERAGAALQFGYVVARTTCCCCKV